ncbi:MAG: sulfurtransferase-like selenium metabolism protein YedF [Desulfobacterales bacterium]|nr:sulfurtransferase-like selenium metabolism protein YedF [Desulfobacterales bacterium]
MKEIDARGLSCPAPVLLTKNTIETEKPEQIRIILDNEASGQNVSRFLSSKNFSVTIDKQGNDLIVTGTIQTGGISKGEDAPFICDISPEDGRQKHDKKIMVMISSDCLGRGDDELGGKLVVNFIKTLKEMGNELWRLVFVNSGVKLTIENAQPLEDLIALENHGVKILVCGTCLDHFKLLEKKRVGETTNMLDIVSHMQLHIT